VTDRDYVYIAARPGDKDRWVFALILVGMLTITTRKPGLRMRDLLQCQGPRCKIRLDPRQAFSPGRRLASGVV
jgi:hypothetical protein